MRMCVCVVYDAGGRIDIFKGDRKEEAGKMHMEPSLRDKSKYSVVPGECLTCHQFIL